MPGASPYADTGPEVSRGAHHSQLQAACEGSLTGHMVPCMKWSRLANTLLNALPFDLHAADGQPLIIPGLRQLVDIQIIQHFCSSLGCCATQWDPVCARSRPPSRAHSFVSRRPCEVTLRPGSLHFT